MRITIQLLIILVISISASAQTPPPGSVILRGATDNTKIGNVGDSLKVTGTSTISGTVTANQGTQGSSGSPWWVNVTNASIPVTQSGTWTVGATISNFPATQAVTQSTSPWVVSLPSGASTSALQTSGNASLTSIDGKTPALVSGRVPVDGSGVTQPVSGTVTANQGTSPWVISGSVITDPDPNSNSNLSARQTVTSSESTVVAPANAVGVIFECESVNVDNLRWGFSNSASSILSSTTGVLCEPGRDSGYLPLGVGNYLHLISTGAGSNFADVQWVLAQ